MPDSFDELAGKPAGRARQSKQNAHGANGRDVTPWDGRQLPSVPWHVSRMSDAAKIEPAPRRWILPDWIPREQVTGLYGATGVNKTDFLLQLLMANSFGLNFLGYELAPVPVYGLFCEDTFDEIIRRAARIADHYNRNLRDFRDFHFASLVGVDETEFVTFEHGKLTALPSLLRFDYEVEQCNAKLAVLDTGPDFFGGNEVVRREATQFVRKLESVSMVRDCAIVLSWHPSVRGAKEGTLDSGSTGWGAKLRARVSLEDPGPEDQQDDDKRRRGPVQRTDRRILTRQESNYAKPGETLDLVCINGVFTLPTVDGQRQAGPAVSKAAQDAACDARFLELLRKVKAQGDRVHNSSNNPSRYAPAVFAKRPDGRGFSKLEYGRAMQRLFVAGRIRLETFGPPSKPSDRLAEVEL